MELSTEKHSAASLKKTLENFHKSSVLVIGDVMWDKYIYGDVSRISPEAPVPVVLSQEEKFMPGGAANVLKNLKALGVSCGIVGIVGKDASGEQMQQEFEQMNLTDIFLPKLSDRPTISKTRVIARNQQLLRVDREIILPLPQETQKKLLEFLQKVLPSYKAIILSDYDKGLLSPKLISQIINLAKQHNVYIAVDPQVRNFSFYHGANIMTPNEKEAMLGKDKNVHLDKNFPPNDATVKTLGEAIISQLQLTELLITRSERGMALFTQADSTNKINKVTYIPTIASQVYDVTGAGDTVISVFTAAIAGGCNSLDAALLSNIAGGLVVKKIGVATTSVEEISQHLQSKHLLYREEY